MSYVDSNGARRVPAMLHRALFGSLERFLGILLEHYRGALPPWLCPEQAIVVPAKAEASGYAREVCSRLAAAGVRAAVDDRDERLSDKVSSAHELGIPYLVVVGKREQASQSVRIRERGGAQRDASLDAAVAELAKEAQG
jgi:threonyl-tRNA synthetase